MNKIILFFSQRVTHLSCIPLETYTYQRTFSLYQSIAIKKIFGYFFGFLTNILRSPRKIFTELQNANN